MPRCTYECASLSQRGGATFKTPRKITDLGEWLYSAVTALEGTDAVGWMPMRGERRKVLYLRGWVKHDHVEVSTRSILFTFSDSLGNRARLVIDRKFDEFGR